MPEKKLRRSTPQRRIILEALREVKTHPTAAELYELVRKRLPRVSLGTVYRNLDVLHADGVINKLDYAGAETRFDGVTDIHHHVRCRACGHIEDVYDLGPGGNPAQPQELAGFKVESYRLEYVGVCPTCQTAADR